MCSVSARVAHALVLALASAAASAGPPMSALVEPPPPAHVAIPPGVLRVCADPNNLPFSNDRGQGFENAIARLLGRALHRKVEYTWWPQRRGFVRMTLRAGACDVIMGVPADYALTDNTRPYYRSTYVFVSPAARHLRLSSLDDPRLQRMRIGVHVIGDDYQNPAPVQALAARRVKLDLRGYSIYGDYSQPDPLRALVDAVVENKVDAAIMWGPPAGYFARSERVALAVSPIAPSTEATDPPMSYAIAVGVRHGDRAWRDQIDAALFRHRRDIERILRSYGVPLAPPGARAQPQRGD